MNCNHIRTESTRGDGGVQRRCLIKGCGHEWFDPDEPMSEDDKFDKAQFQAHQRQEQLVKESGYRK